MVNPENILTTQIAVLEVDEIFKSGSAKMGFNSIGDILAFSIKDLKQMEGFSYRWLEAYMSILETYGLIDKI